MSIHVNDDTYNPQWQTHHAATAQPLNAPASMNPLGSIIEPQPEYLIYEPTDGNHYTQDWQFESLKHEDDFVTEVDLEYPDPEDDKHTPAQTVDHLPAFASTYPIPPRSSGPGIQFHRSWDPRGEKQQQLNDILRARYRGSELLWDLIEKQEKILGSTVDWHDFTREQDGDDIIHQMFEAVRKSAPNEIPSPRAFCMENDVRKTHLCVANLMLRLSYRLLHSGGHDSDLENTSRLTTVTRVLAGVIEDLVTIERDTRNFIDSK